MTADTLFQRTPRYLILSLLALALSPGYVQARTYNTSAHEELYAPYSRQELAQMVAPVALYPDALLAQVLMAATYPIEVVEAERWVQNNPGLRNDALDAALLRQNWDPSVKALTHFPSILTMMSERIAETTELGNAFLAQEADVMVMVQELRAQAYDHGNLKSDDHQRVVVEQQTIIIQSVNPRVVYVPYYDPLRVYGSWWYPAYPPRYWGPSGIHVSYVGYWPGFYFNFTFGNWSYFDWPRRVIYVEAHTRPRFVERERWVTRTVIWQHAPAHRRGVAYRDHATTSRFSAPNRTGATSRQLQTRPRVDRHEAAPARSSFSTTP